MSCICKVCEQPNSDCEFAICTWCWLEMTDDDTIRNIALGGRFYPSVKQEVTNEQVDKQEVVGVSHHGVLRRGNSRGGILDE